MKTQLAIIPSLLAAAGVSLAGTSDEAAASGNRAVSAPNGKLDTGYANLNSEDAWFLGGSYSRPLSEYYGFQLDALYTDAGDDQFTGLGGHLFWRDYEVGLIGLTAGGIWGDDVDSYEFGVEAESYFNDWLTIGARAGFADIDYDSGPFLADSDDDGFYGVLYATAYATEDLAITASITQRFDRSAVSIGAEYDLPTENLTLFAEGMWGEDGYDHALIGLRYYFGSGGSSKTLQQRHRQDDPPSLLPGLLQPTQYKRENPRRRKR